MVIAAAASLTPAEIEAWAAAINILISGGAATVAQIRQWFGGTILTNDQLNAILDGVLQDALTREAQAKKAAGLS